MVRSSHLLLFHYHEIQYFLFVFAVFIRGDNIYGQLGYKTSRRESRSLIPLKLEVLNNVDIVEVNCCGLANTCAVTATGAIYMWGERGGGRGG